MAFLVGAVVKEKKTGQLFSIVAEKFTSMAEVAGVERGGTEGGTEGGGGGGGRGRGGERRGQADGGGEARELATPDSCIADFCLIPVNLAPTISPIFPSNP